MLSPQASLPDFKGDMGDAALIGGVVAIAMALVKIIEKLIDKQGEKKNGNPMDKLAEILDRLERKSDERDRIMLARDSEDRPRVWHPEAAFNILREEVGTTGRKVDEIHDRVCHPRRGN